MVREIRVRSYMKRDGHWNGSSTHRCVRHWQLQGVLHVHGLLACRLTVMQGHSGLQRCVQHAGTGCQDTYWYSPLTLRQVQATIAVHCRWCAQRVRNGVCVKWRHAHADEMVVTRQRTLAAKKETHCYTESWTPLTKPCKGRGAMRALGAPKPRTPIKLPQQCTTTAKHVTKYIAR